MKFKRAFRDVRGRGSFHHDEDMNQTMEQHRLQHNENIFHINNFQARSKFAGAERRRNSRLERKLFKAQSSSYKCKYLSATAAHVCLN